MSRYQELVALAAVSLLLSQPLVARFANAKGIEVAQKCKKSGVCGGSEYWGGKVRIKLFSNLSRTTHFNFKTNPGDQIELDANGQYTFEMPPGESGTYSAQACDRGGIGARSTCTKWGTFDWTTGGSDDADE